ncbi:RHS repeat-associated core domain-containing protein [Salmonella enterica]|nr:RHS repeat-associated core domain-containing protein [Salmonella enterica]EJW2034218.1 RHS repeat-associated core domain-containing protein [Salmonella enterica]EJW2037851.1 RHS repeat-associated core domain-containing protein [Salmonella enterica]EJW2069906.1 RHS repeat-associated core domain-containing protein [Salmonella enterica]EJW2078405.1 RHS repeat-associated core domain-containing protein [Salmonella enterica]
MYFPINEPITFSCSSTERETYLWDGDIPAEEREYRNGTLWRVRRSYYNGFELLAQDERWREGEEGESWREEMRCAISSPAGEPQALYSPEGECVWRKTLWGVLLWPENLRDERREPGLLYAGQQVDRESGLAYNRHRYYCAETACYLTADPIGLAGGWNLYTYPLNPVTDIDPLGLATLQQIVGPNAYNTMQGSNVGFDTNLSDEERSKALDDFSNMRGIYNPLDTYVKGWAFGAPAMPLLVTFAPAESTGAAFAGAGLSCASNSAFQLYKGDKFNYKDAGLAALTGFLAPGRSLFENALIAMRITFLNKDGELGATGGVGAGTVASDIINKLAPSYIPDPVVEFGGGVVSEYIGDKSEEIFDTEEEKK